MSDETPKLEWRQEFNDDLVARVKPPETARLAGSPEIDVRIWYADGIDKFVVSVETVLALDSEEECKAAAEKLVAAAVLVGKG